MNKRPRSVTVISWIFIAFGGIALLAGLLPPADTAAAQRVAEFKTQHPFESAPIFVVQALAVLCGVFMLYGFNQWSNALQRTAAMIPRLEEGALAQHRFHESSHTQTCH